MHGAAHCEDWRRESRFWEWYRILFVVAIVAVVGLKGLNVATVLIIHG